MAVKNPDRLGWIHTLPCCCCQKEEIAQPNPTEAHHIVDKGYREHSGGDEATLPLCRWYHRGVPIEGWSASKMTFEYGPSLALHKKRFIDTYGTERELLEQVNAGQDPDTIF